VLYSGSCIIRCVDANNVKARGVRNQNIPTKLRLTYYQDKTLTLDLQYETEGTWKNCFSVAAPKLPNVAYLGFSAETGELSDNHDLIAVSTKNIYAGRSGTRAGDQKFTPGGGRGRKSGSGGGWGWFFLKFLLFGLGVTGAYVGLTMYRASSQRSRF
jgi:mannose-binding lectin 2